MNKKYSFAYPEWINKNQVLDPKKVDRLRRVRDKICSKFSKRVKFYKPVAYYTTDDSAVIQDFKIFGKYSNAYIFRLWAGEDKVSIIGSYIPDGDLLKPGHTMINCNSISGLLLVDSEINKLNSNKYIFANTEEESAYMFNRSKNSFIELIFENLNETIATYKKYNRKEFKKSILAIYNSNKTIEMIGEDEIKVVLCDFKTSDDIVNEKLDIETWKSNIEWVLSFTTNFLSNTRKVKFKIKFEMIDPEVLVEHLIEKRFIKVIIPDYYEGSELPVALNYSL